MSGYTDIFSDGLVPPAGDSYQALTITSDTTLCWPFNYDGSVPYASKILDVYGASGNHLYLPPVDQVSKGESLIIRNKGATSLNICDSNGLSLAVLSPGIAQFLWVTNNVQPGAWGQVTYGAGSSSASAGSLAGYGTKATGATLSVSAPTLTQSGDLTLLTSHRGTAIEFNSGTADLILQDTSVYGGDFYCFIKNAGTGMVTITPDDPETVDDQLTMGLQPSESLILMCNGSGKWYTVGYGRSILFQFSQLVLDVSAGGTFTLNSAQASNKMLTFVGNPGASVNVVVPSIVGVYYVANNLSTNQSIQVKTASVVGTNVAQTQRAVLLCDGTSVTAAQSVAVSSAVSMLDGSESAPALNFLSQTNTGFYKYSTKGMGLSVDGVSQWYSNGDLTGVEFPLGISIDGIRLKTSNTGSLLLPVGTTAQRDVAPGLGYKRFNSTLNKEEVWNGSAWVAGGGATGAGGDDVFYENSQIVSNSYTISTGKNAISAGPITVADGVTVTIPDGSTWSVV